MEILSEQEVKLIEVLRMHDAYTASKIAKVLQVSEKTARSLIQRLNQKLPESVATIETKPGTGCMLRIYDAQTLEKLLKESRLASSQIPNTPEERVSYLIFVLLNEESVEMEDMIDELFISERQLRNDLKNVEKKLDRFNLTLSKSTHGSLSILGSEADIRLCLSSLGTFYDEYIQAKLDKQEIENIVKFNLNKYDIRLSDINYRQLIRHILLSLMRMMDSYYVYSPISKNDLSNTIEFEAANNIANELSKAYQVVYSLYEIEYITIHILGKETIKDKNSVIIDTEIDGLIDDILAIIKTSFNIDWIRNFDLRIALYLHFGPMINRLKYNMAMENPILDEIKEHYAYAYTMALVSNSVIFKKYGKNLTEGEVGYIALSFELELEKEKKPRIRKKRILLVCNLGRVTSELLKQKYEEIFGEYIDRIVTGSIHSLDKINLNEFDLVMTTVHLSQEMSIPVVEINAIPTMVDEGNMKKVLIDQDYIDFHAICRKTCFLSHIQSTNKQEILKRMCIQLEKEYAFKEDLYASVCAREEAAPTDIYYCVALPHTFSIISETSCVCVAILDKPILWTMNEVQVVFLVSVGNEREKNQKFYSTLSKFLLNNKKIDRLIKNQDYEEMIEMIERVD